MKKKIIFIVCLCSLLFAGMMVHASGENALFYRFGKILHSSENKEENSSYRDTIVYSCKDFDISSAELQKMTDVFSLRGDENAENAALQYILERETIYHEATHSGISVSDEELRSYCDNIRKELEDAENLEEVKSLYAAFGGEETYWKEMTEVYRKAYVISKYWEEKQTDYEAKLPQTMDPEEKYDRWTLEQARITADLIEAEGMKKVVNP